MEVDKNMKQNDQRKIGIVTLHGYYNYGNRLQNYALLKTLSKFDAFVQTCVVDMPVSKEVLNLSRLNHILSNSPTDSLKRVVNKLSPVQKKTQTTKDAGNSARYDIFKSFSKEHLNETFVDVNKDKDEIDSFDYFVTGSDQVWNPLYFVDMPKYFLTFAPQEKRIAYSPSISTDSIPFLYRNKYKQWLEEMAAVSVREKAGLDIIKDLTGIEAPVLVDPTMLLDKDEWLSIAKRANNRPDSNYLLTYFLGGPDQETRKKINQLAKENDMTVINLGDPKEVDTYETGPSEFLDYINNASAFFTDSFHGVVYSIIFQTPFVVYERISSAASMYSRIETLLNNFNLKHREAKGFNDDVLTVDFSHTPEILQREVEKSKKYLEKALRIEE